MWEDCTQLIIHVHGRCAYRILVPPENLEMSERMGVIFLSSFSPMPISLTTLLATLSSIFRSRAALGLENLALHHQLTARIAISGL